MIISCDGHEGKDVEEAGVWGPPLDGESRKDPLPDVAGERRLKESVSGAPGSGTSIGKGWEAGSSFRNPWVRH